MLSLRRRFVIASAASLLAVGVGVLGATPAGAAAPGNVTGLTATPLSPTSIKLDWTNPASAGLVGVHICRANGAVAPTMPCSGVNVAKTMHTYTDTTHLIPNTQYTYSVFAYSSSAVAVGGASVTVSTPQSPAPANVTGLAATPLSPTSIKLDWANPANTDFAGVHICRAYGAVAPTMPCSGVNVDKTMHTYTDMTQLIPNTQYTYGVFAYNTSAVTASGASVTVSTPQSPAPANVTGLTATPAPSTSITLDWTNPTDADFAGVHICRAYGAVAPTMPCAGVNVAKTMHTYTDSYQVLPGTQYTYAVFAYNTSAVTASGSSVTTTTP